MQDVNTLIDVGRDPAIFEKIQNASTGVGKKRVEQVILTHNHYDHAEILERVKSTYKSKVYAFSKAIKEVDINLFGGERIKIGDCMFDVIHTPGHSSDSICLYNADEKVLFAGDTPLVILTNEGSYDDAFIAVVKYLSKLPIDTIYFGHGAPLRTNCSKVLHNTLRNITK